MSHEFSSGESVAIVRHHGWGEIVLCRPHRKNAITGPMGLALAAALKELAEDGNNRLVLLRGAGGSFCSGLDLKELKSEPSPSWIADFPWIWRSVHRALFESKIPLIGALERHAINAGAALALACDVLITGESAYLQVGEAKLGMAAPYNMAWLALRHASAVAAELAVIAEPVPGPRLLRLGVAQRCVSDDAVVDEARELCTQLAAYPEQGLAHIKNGLNAAYPMNADAWFDHFTHLENP